MIPCPLWEATVRAAQGAWTRALEVLRVVAKATGAHDIPVRHNVSMVEPIAAR